VLRTHDRAAEARELEERLTEKVARENLRLSSPLLRLRHARASARLLEAVRSPEGLVYPRRPLETPEGPGPPEAN
jgi:hypothetical protein